MSRWRTSVVGALLAAGVAASGCPQGFAQFGGRQIGGGEETSTSVQPPTERTAARGMQRARTSIAAGEYSQAIRFLDEMLGRQDDMFVELSGELAGLKETAQRWVRDLPPEGRQAYEASYGAVAQRLLRSAIDRGDAASLEQAARRYFYTPAGSEAALLLAMNEADAGRYLSAALICEQLLDWPEAARRFDPELSVQTAACWLAAGDEMRARQALDRLLAQGRRSVEVAGRSQRFDSAGEPLAWLREVVGNPAVSAAGHERQWLMARGNAARNGSVKGGLPHLRVRWEVPLLGAPKLETLFENLSTDLMRTNRMAPIANNVIAAGDYILTRTPHGLLAVDFTTGKRVWRSEPQRETMLERLIQTASGAEEESTDPESVRSFARRLWEDYLYGTISCDGVRLYMIGDLPAAALNEYQFSPMMGDVEFSSAGTTNRLSAYELATEGKLIWEVSGDQLDGELAGAFFLGAPLPLGNSLFALAEAKSAVYLVAINRETGAVEWRQPLAHLETGVQMDMRRRLQAAMPSYEAGMLVCPTGAGVTVGVDLAKRSLAWFYRYDAVPLVEYLYQEHEEGGSSAGARRWLDNAVAIADDKALLTPPESKYLHCVDLRTGKLLWKRERGELARLACIDQGRVLLTGNKKLQTLDLHSGKPAWPQQTLTLPRGTFAAGTGFASEGLYYLPLTSSEVIAVDMAEGRIAARAAARNGVPLGNLICHRGTVISQNGEFLDCYDQIDVLRRRSQRRLARQPDDVEALRTLGEVALNEGRLSEAIDLLERAYRAAPSDIETKEVLVECLAEALDKDFPAHREQFALLKELDDGSAGRGTLIQRLESQGMLELNDRPGAAAACLKLYELTASPDELISIGQDHQTSVACWVRQQLATIWNEASQDERRRLRAIIDDRFQRTDASLQGDELRRWLAFFGGLPIAEPLKLRQAQELASAGQSLEAQQLFLDLEESTDPTIRRAAVCAIAAQLHDAGLHALAADYDAAILGRWADQQCLPGQTGAALVAAWREAAGTLPGDWPRGRVKVNMLPTSPAMRLRVRSPMWAIRLERTDSILGRSNAQLSTRGGEIVLHDNYGREFFSANVNSENNIQYRAAGSVYGTSRGNLLVVSLGKQIAAFNSLASSDPLAPPVLWRASAAGSVEYDAGFQQAAGGESAARPGSHRAPRPIDEEGTWVGVIGPISSQGVVFQDQRRLTCLDPISGEVRWSRTDVPLGCELFGDDRHVFALPNGSRQALVFSAVDGRSLGQRNVPPFQEQLVTYGRRVIRWKTAGSEAELSSIDAWTGEVEWSRRYDSGAAIDLDMGRFAVVVDSSGRVSMIDVADGAELVDYQSPEALHAMEVHLAVGHDHFLVAVRSSRPQRDVRRVQGFNAIDSPVIDGTVMLFDRAGGRMRWSRPADVLQQPFLLTQPVDLPFIMFAGQFINRDASGSRPASTLLLLDKATGRTILRADDLPQNGGGQCLAYVSEASQRQATVEMAGRTIVLQFTDERRPPEPPAMAEVETMQTKGGGLMGIILKIGGS